MTLAPRSSTAPRRAIERGTGRLLELQHPDGWWVGELESNATMIAQHLFWHHFLGLRTPELDRKIANELLARQRDDGTWAIWFEGPADLSTTIEAYAALKLAGVDPGPQRARLHPQPRRHPASRVFTKCFLALLGQWPWQRIPPMPVGDRSCCRRRRRSRSTTSPAGRGGRSSRSSVVQALRPVRPGDIDLREIGARPGTRRAPPRGPRALRRGRDAPTPSAGCASARRRTAPGAGSSRRGSGRSSCSPRSATASRTRRSGARSRAGRASRSTRATGCAPRRASRPCGTRRSRSSRSAPPASPAEHLRSSAPAEWLLGEEVTVEGDWAVRRPTSRPAAGRSSSRTTSTRTSTTRRSSRSRCARSASATTRSRAALDWTRGMQSRSGGWGAFDVDNEALWLYRLPFCDFGKVTDEPSADVTAHALEALAAEAGYEDVVRARPRLAPRRAGGGRLVVRPLGRQPRLRHRRRAAGARGLRRRPPATRPCAARSPGSTPCRTRTAASARTSARTPIRPGAAAAPRTPSQTAWALLAYVAAGDAERVAAGARRVALRRAGPRRRLGRRSTTLARAFRSTS